MGKVLVCFSSKALLGMLGMLGCMLGLLGLGLGPGGIAGMALSTVLLLRVLLLRLLLLLHLCLCLCLCRCRDLLCLLLQHKRLRHGLLSSHDCFTSGFENNARKGQPTAVIGTMSSGRTSLQNRCRVLCSSSPRSRTVPRELMRCRCLGAKR